MTSAAFQSGEWRGYYTYTGRTRKHRMDIALEFRNGKVSGEGRDDIGDFVLSGSYNASSRECFWRKEYIGRHTVVYEGFGEGRRIWGTWSINWTGGFMIWPVGEESGAEEAEKAEEPIDETVLEPMIV